MPRHFVPNDFAINGDVVTLTLTQGKFTVVDRADFEHVRVHRWHAAEVSPGNWYAASSTVSGRFLHRFVTNAPRGQYVDHRNHDTLDNRRGNLRVGTQAANIANRRAANTNSKSGARGVSFWPQGPYWVLRCQIATCKIMRYFPPTDEGLALATAASAEHFEE